MSNRGGLLAELLASPPPIHWLDGEPQPWGLNTEVLEWIAAHTPAGANTLETGCGVSSILFTLTAASHTIVAPEQSEHDRVREWCEARGVSTDHVRSVVDLSWNALPGLKPDPLDVVLLDGAHAFPVPFIDWYYAATRLNIGGTVILDDMHIPSCRLLRDFLASDTTRWTLRDDIRRAAIFEKLADPIVPALDWVDQPWSNGGNGSSRRVRSFAPRLIWKKTQTATEVRTG